MIETVRDIAIIILAVQSIVFFLIMSVVAWQAYRLVRLVQSKTEEFSALGRTVMESARETASTASETATRMKGSADFVSDTVVSPVVQVAGAVAGARAFVGALFRLQGSSENGGGR